MLVDHADPLPGAAELALPQPGQLLSRHGDGARGGALQEVDTAQQGALAGAALPEHAEDLAFADMQVDAVDGDHLAAPISIDLSQT